MKNNSLKREKVFFISLGCPKNLVDTEHMAGCVHGNGLEITHAIEDASICVINTCAFIREAVEEAVDTILYVADFKTKGLIRRLVVTGCLVQRYGYKLALEIPEVDAWLGTGEYCRILEVLDKDTDQAQFFIGRPMYLADHNVPRVVSTPFYTAYIKIAEGCSHRCSFCTIPAIRGPFRSRSIDSVVLEAKALAKRGVKEVTLVAQDTTMYGKDRNTCLENLLERLVTVKGLQWIRLMYCYPDGITDRLLRLIETEEKICPYIDIPFQHVNEEILLKMRRPPFSHRPEELISRIRGISRRVSLRTSLIVGFPGETDNHFKELYDFVKEAMFDHVGVFVYSREEGTHAARMKDQVPREIALERKDMIMSIQSKVSETKNRQLVGKVLPVIIEGNSDETDLLLKGRSPYMAPDGIDGQVLINRGEGVYGEIMPVLVTEAYAYDLIGEIHTK